MGQTGVLKIQNQFFPTCERETVKFSKDETPYLQIYNANSIQDPTIHALGPRDIRSYANLRRDLIHDHVDRRIQLFFTQLVLCYNTPFFYEAFGAEDQIGAGSKQGIHTQGAHSSTLPCLYASPRDQNGQPDLTRRFVYLKHSHAYNQHNGTVELIEPVNALDTFLDGNQKDTVTERLRSKALKIVNDVAQGDLSPTKGTLQFLNKFDEELGRVLATLPVDDNRHYIATIYRDRLEEVQGEIENSKETFDYIMGLKIAGSDEEKLLRKIVYNGRYKMIQVAERIESEIARKILDAQNAIFKTHLKTLKRVDNRLRYLLLSESDAELRLLLEKWFCTSREQLDAVEARKSTTLRGFQTRAHKVELRQSYPQIINKLRRELRVLSHELTQAEFTYRAALFKNLRVKYKDWTQEGFVAAYKAVYADSMSQPMVSRLEQPSRLPTGYNYLTPLEQRVKMINVDKAEHIAATFGVDTGLFIHGFVA